MITTIKNAGARVRDFFLPLSERKKKIRLGLILGACILIAVLSQRGTGVEESAQDMLPVVTVGTVADVASASDASFVGTVRAVSEAQIQSEVGGRITAVYAKPGDTVSAGKILASIQNATQQAALLQAEGVYEAALANAAQSQVSVEDAENSLLSARRAAINAYRDVYTDVSAVVLNTIDTFFANPDARFTPGVRIDTSKTAYLNSTRVGLQDILKSWQGTSNILTPTSDLDAAFDTAEENIRIVTDMTDVLIEATRSAKANEVLDGEPVTSYTEGLTVARGTLSTALSTLASTEAALRTAEESLRRAQIGGTQNPTASLANAQVKQALGSLRSAQANYEKTVFRSPISGTVNSMRVHTGDFISAFTPIAEVANNNALQISVYVGEADLSRLSVGQTVRIRDDILGTVTGIAPAVDPVTQKTEVRIATESRELTNGSTVTVTLDARDNVTDTAPLTVPITAIRFSASHGSVFVVEEGILVAKEVEVGSINGSLVTITRGIDRNTEFVLDARGLSEGAQVEAIRK